MAPGQASPRRARLFLLGKVGVSAGLLGLLFWRVDRAAFLNTIRAMPLHVFLGCFLLYLLGYLLSTVRWQRLLAAENIRIPLWRLTLLYFEGAFFNLFLPTLIGGDIVRGYAIYRLTGGHNASLASILIDRLSGFAALMLIALLSLSVAVTRIPHAPVALMILGVAAAFGLLMAILLNDRMKDWAGSLFRLVGLARFQARLQGLVEAIHRYRSHRRALAQALLLSAVLQALIIVAYYFVGRGLKVGVPLAYFFVFVPLITVVAMLPVSVAGLGVREGGAVYFFALVGVDAATSLSMALVWFALTVLTSSLGALAILANAHYAKRSGD
ncbi:MAG: flippase-like domain-containing protein [candidate division NC10 bacterium]|nr:flippase-like domain-containing protein [candidate division NC10 bacterium]